MSSFLPCDKQPATNYSVQNVVTAIFFTNLLNIGVPPMNWKDPVSLNPKEQEKKRALTVAKYCYIHCVKYPELCYLIEKKHKRCGQCYGCKSEDCGACTFCTDKPKYGDQGS